jgi:outer membrane protein
MAIVTRRTAGLPLFVAFLAVLPHAAQAQTTLTLDEAMRRARRESAQARSLDATAAEAAARVRRARAGLWPRLDVAETVQRGDQPVFVFGSLLGQRRFTEANFAIAALNRPDPLTNTRTSVSIQQPLFDATRLEAVRAARLDAERAAATREGAGQDLAFGAAVAFVRVVQLESLARAAEAAVAAADSDRERARLRRETGLVTDADVLAADVRLAEVRERRIATAGDLAVARLALADLAGLPLTGGLVAVAPAPVPAQPDADALVREALDRHPQPRQAAVQRQLAESGQRAARAALLPTVGAIGGWEANGSTFGRQQASWLAGVELRVNVFNGFGDRARLAEASHARARAAAEEERVRRALEVEVRAAVAHLHAAIAREEAGRAALTQAQESQRIVRERYDTGLATMTDVLRAADAVLEAESRATAARMDAVLRGVALDRAVGRL